MTTPESLLSLAAKLTELGGALTGVGGQLAEVAGQLEQEAANLAEEQSKRFGFEVQVAVGVKGGPGVGNSKQVMINGAPQPA